MGMIIQTLVGLFQGLATELVKLYRDVIQSKLEIEFLEKTAKIEQARAAAGLGDQNDDQYVPDAFTLPVQFTKTGFTKIDKFNAMMRPVVSLIAIVVLVCLIGVIAYLVIMDPTAQLAAKVQLLQTGLIADFILSVLGFLFGYRSATKMWGK